MLRLSVEPRDMRRGSPDVPDREALAAYVTVRAAGVDGRLGVLVGRPAGPTVDDFDVLVAHEADREYESASVIKLPILTALYRRHDDDLDALDAPHGIAPENRVGGTGLLHMLDSQEPSLRDLARAMVAVSDNAATNELVDYVGMDAVDDVADDLGMEHTHLRRKMMTTVGGDGSDEPVNTTSPRDCARLFATLLHGDTLSQRACEEQLEILRNQTDRSMFPRYYPYEVALAHKTGWLPDAALDTGLVTGFGEPLFFAAFCDRCDNGGEATDVVAEVGDATLAWLRNQRS